MSAVSSTLRKPAISPTSPGRDEAGTARESRDDRSTRAGDRMHAESTYLIRGTLYRGDSPALQAALAEVYGGDERPSCLCVERGVEMYVAQHSQLLIKRMPGTGPAHHPSCPSYDAPASETGLGDLLGEADHRAGAGPRGGAPGFPAFARFGAEGGAGYPRAVAERLGGQRRLSMRGLLHLLWDRAGSPAGRRGWRESATGSCCGSTCSRRRGRSTPRGCRSRAGSSSRSRSARTPRRR